MKAKPYQVAAIDNVDDVLENRPDITRLILTSPTGGGKTFMAGELIKRWKSRGYRVGLYTNRRQMIKQLGKSLDRFGIEHAVRASGRVEKHHVDVQICMIQTEQSKARKAEENMAEHVLHDCDRVIVDECHLNKGPGMRAIIQKHEEQGSKILGLSATPLDLEGLYQMIIEAGTVSELRECGMLVPALHFAPDEPDVQAFKRFKKKYATIEQDTWAPSESMAHEMMMTPSIIGRVWDWFNRLNPEHGPSLLFAPSVEGSVWFARRFEERGVRAAHLASNGIWLDGKPHNKTNKLVQYCLDESEAGRLPVICNRFVMREGIDMPWLRHMIFATVFGSLQTYLQAAGRGLRADTDKPHVILEDHGGNWWRWGSANLDRHWHIEHTGSMLMQKRADQLRHKPGDETEPFVCPKCALVMKAGRCINCGWTPGLWIKERPVVSVDGSLRLMRGDIFRPRTIYQRRDGAEKWESIYWASYKNAPDRTFRMASVIFARLNYWMWPDPSWPLMPKDDEDWYFPVSLVPFDRLNPKPPSGAQHGPKKEQHSFIPAGDDRYAGEGETAEDETSFSAWDDPAE